MVHDRTGSYDMALLMSVGAFVLAVGAAWMLPEFREGEGPGTGAVQDGGAAGAQQHAAVATGANARGA
jgi:hypothetical protein